MQYMIAPTNNDLYHHGILGQKWGKRNGPPYPLGTGAHSARENKAGWRKSLSKTYSGQNNKKINDKELINKIKARSFKTQYEIDTDSIEDKSKAGIERKEERVEFNRLLKDDNTIKKGTTVERVTTSDEVLDDKRKYVSMLTEDKRNYREIFDYLVDPYKELAIDTYEFKKDAKFANADEVFNWMVDKYGDLKIKEAYENSKKLKNESDALDFIQYVSQKKTDKVQIKSDRYKKDVKAFSKDEIKRIKEIKEELDNLDKFKKELFNTKVNDETVKEFKKRGYDAIIDIEDAGSFASAPLIVLDPQNSLKMIKRETW